MNQYTFDNKINVIKDLNLMNIPEISNIFNLETNPYYFETITEDENETIDYISFEQKQKLLREINPNQSLKLGDKLVKYWINETVEAVGTKTFNWAYWTNPFSIEFKEVTQIIFLDLAQLKSKLSTHKTRYYYVELKTNHSDIISICFDTLLKESFYICFSDFKLDLDEYDFVQALSYFSNGVGYKFNSEKTIKLSDNNNSDSVLLISYLLLVLTASDLHESLEKIISNGETSAIGYTILKTWLWYNYIMGFSNKPYVALSA